MNNISTHPTGVENDQKSSLKNKITETLVSLFQYGLTIGLASSPELSPLEKDHLFHSIKKYGTDPDYIKQASIEGLQRCYEHTHFLGGPFPKMIDCRRGKGLVSKTPIKKYGKGRRGRVALVPGDAITGYFFYTKGRDIIQDTQTAVYEVISGKLPTSYDIVLLVCFNLLGTSIYYGIIKPADIKEAVIQLEHTHAEDLSSPIVEQKKDTILSA